MRITARKHGVNEGTTKSDAALAVQSIPAYVEVGTLGPHTGPIFYTPNGGGEL